MATYSDRAVQGLECNGGAPSRLSVGEIECMYCSSTIPRGSYQRTCPICRAKWEKQFGMKWYTADWHTELIAAHVALFSTSPTSQTVELVADVADVGHDAGTIDGYKPMALFTTCYLEVKDIVAAVEAAKVPEVRDRCKVPAGHWTLTAIGKTKMRSMLSRRGYREATVEDIRREALPHIRLMPGLEALKLYINRARNEIQSDIGLAVVHTENPEALKHLGTLSTVRTAARAK